MNFNILHVSIVRSHELLVILQMIKNISVSVYILYNDTVKQGSSRKKSASLKNCCSSSLRFIIF